jgi:hypothetical protein
MVRDGKMNDSNFSSRMRGVGGYADYVQNVFRMARKKYGLTNRDKDLRTDLFRRPNEMTLFDED